MLSTLPASGYRPKPSKAGIATSILLHGSLIGAAVFMTARVVAPPKEKIEEHPLLFVETKPAPPPVPPPKPLVQPKPQPPKPQVKAEPKKVYVAPRAAPQPPTPAPKPVAVPPGPVAPPMPSAPVKVAVNIPAIDPNATPTITDVVSRGNPPPSAVSSTGSDKAGSDRGDAKPSGVSKDNGEAFTGDEVDKAVQLRSGAPDPVYPASLSSSGITGEVTVRFVVDAAGRVEGGSVEIVNATRSEFAEAVRRVLKQYRFRPAEANGHPVRQLVERSFTFKLSG